MLLAVGLVLLAGCARPVSEAYTTQVPATTTSAGEPAPAQPAEPAPEAPITITGTGFDLHAAGRVGQAALDAAGVRVLETLNRYLEAAVLTPLRSGGPAGDLSSLFTPLAVGRVTAQGPDRAALVDEGLPPATGLRPEATVVTLTALAGPDGVMSVVSAGLDLRLTGRVDGEALSVARTGELVLISEGDTWRIDAWDLKVTRTLSKATTTPEARS